MTKPTKRPSVRARKKDLTGVNLAAIKRKLKEHDQLHEHHLADIKFIITVLHEYNLVRIKNSPIYRGTKK